MHNKIKRSVARLALALAAVTFVTGCQTYKSQNTVLQHWQRGDLVAAEREANLKVQKQGERNKVIWQLEHATVMRAVGKPQESVDSFTVAEQAMDQYAEQAKVRVGAEAGALLSNQANLRYEGRDYDMIMLNTYKALDFLALGKVEEARTEIIRAQQRQDDAKENNKKRIEAAEQDEEVKKEKEGVEKAQNDDRFKQQYSSHYGELDALKLYSDYENPFASLLNGMIFMSTGSSGSDWDRARNAFARALAANPENKYLKNDADMAESLMNGKELSATTYVIFETGQAPMRDQLRIDIPVIVGPVPYVGAAVPKLVLQNEFVPSLTVVTTNGSESTALVASMDSVIGRAFKNELPTIITKTIASTIAKAAKTYASNKAAEQAGGFLELGMKLGNAIYDASVNIADLRTWTTLPKEFHYARLSTPGDRKLELQTPSGQKVPVTLEDGKVNVVYVRSISPASPLLVSQFKLK